MCERPVATHSVRATSTGYRLTRTFALANIRSSAHCPAICGSARHSPPVQATSTGRRPTKRFAPANIRSSAYCLQVRKTPTPYTPVRATSTDHARPRRLQSQTSGRQHIALQCARDPSGREGVLRMPHTETAVRSLGHHKPPGHPTRTSPSQGSCAVLFASLDNLIPPRIAACRPVRSDPRQPIRQHRPLQSPRHLAKPTTAALADSTPLAPH